MAVAAVDARPREPQTGEANRLILAASTLNMVLPSKMGDIAKAYFMTERGHMSGSLALCLVVFEKASDMMSLLLWCVFGLALYRDKNWLFWAMTAMVLGGLAVGLLAMGSARFAGSMFELARKLAPKKLGAKFEKLGLSWREMQNYFWQDTRLAIKVSAVSILYGSFISYKSGFHSRAEGRTPFVINLALSPLSILAGLVPLTFAGVGTRDAALIFFYSPFFDAATAAALGLLCTSRYLIPAIGGLPFLGQYLATARRLRNQPGD